MNRGAMAWLCAVAVASVACGSTAVLNLGGDGGSLANPGDGGAGAEGDTSSSGAGQDDASGSGDVGGTLEGGLSIVPGNSFPCGTNVCSAPSVCCEQLPNFAPSCAAPGLCNDVAIGCTATTCPTGSLCCVSIQQQTSSQYTGWTRCIETSTCPAGTQQACVQNPGDIGPMQDGCPSDSFCNGIFANVTGCVPDFGPIDASVD